MTRQGFYVAMTRGRDANHAYTPTDGPAPDCPDSSGSGESTGRQILEQVLAADGAELSATATLRQRQNEATAPARLRAVRDTLALSPGPDTADTTAQIDALLRHRLAATRSQEHRPRRFGPPPTSAPDGISR